MTSRRAESFDEIVRQVSEETAADFHERWVVGYGHASVAEHAVVHLAVENISRLACDGLEDNRLASYTEKSSRYQVMPDDYFHIPAELDGYPGMRREYEGACRYLFDAYRKLIDGCVEHLRGVRRQGAREGDSAYRLRVRRIATDGCRAVLPAATLTNVGVTANARTLEHGISKLLSSGLEEERQLGLAMREQGRAVTPTLIKYAEETPYLERRQRRGGGLVGSPDSVDGPPRVEVRLVHWDGQAEEKLAAALLYGVSGLDYPAVWERAQAMTGAERQGVIDDALSGIGPYDAPPRELEVVDYTFEFLLDYGAFREFRRHRMQTYLPQALTVAHGVRTPTVVAEAGLEPLLVDAAGVAERAFHRIYEVSPAVAQYVVTHAHNRRLVSKLNLRECYHLFKLRTSAMAHESIRVPMLEALGLARERHPGLFRGLRLRD